MEPTARRSALFLKGALVGAAYYVGALVGIALKFPSHSPSALWPPNSILLSALLLLPTLIRKGAPPRKDRLQINEAIREVIELTRGEAVKNGVSVRTELSDALPLVEGGRVELQQVMLNLIINAIEAMSGTSDGSRELIISTGKAESGGVLVAVRDSGRGLAPATLEHIFDGFYTTKPSGMAWAYRSAIRSSKRTADDCGPWRTCARGRFFSSRCRSARRGRRDRSRGWRSSSTTSMRRSPENLIRSIGLRVQAMRSHPRPLIRLPSD